MQALSLCPLLLSLLRSVVQAHLLPRVPPLFEVHQVSLVFFLLLFLLQKVGALSSEMRVQSVLSLSSPPPHPLHTPPHPLHTPSSPSHPSYFSGFKHRLAVPDTDPFEQQEKEFRLSILEPLDDTSSTSTEGSADGASKVGRTLALCEEPQILALCK